MQRLLAQGEQPDSRLGQQGTLELPEAYTPLSQADWSSRREWQYRPHSLRTGDHDSTYATKGGTPARMGYYDNYLVDNQSCVIVGVQAAAARMSQETAAAQLMLTRFTQWQGREPESALADTTYGNGEFLQWLAHRSFTAYMRTRDSIHRERSPFFGPERSTHVRGVVLVVAIVFRPSPPKWRTEARTLAFSSYKSRAGIQELRASMMTAEGSPEERRVGEEQGPKTDGVSGLVFFPSKAERHGHGLRNRGGV